jgi:hypothetical protein
MGDYAEQKEIKTRATQDVATPHRKPLPKGSDGSKPVAHAQGQKPKPKRSGAMYEAHQGRRAAQDLLQGELVLDSDHPTGNWGIDSSGMGVCAKGGQGCFLKPMQRQMLIIDFQSRVESAQGFYRDAVNDCRLKQVLKKTDELPWYLTILMSAAFSALEGAVTAGVAALKKTGAATQAVADATKSGASQVANGSVAETLKAAVEEANLEGVAKAGADEVTHVAEHEVKSLADQQIETLIKTSADIAKEKSSAAMTAPISTDSKETNEKNAALGYIGFLRDTSALFFQELREGPPGTATDAELLALWRSFDASHHTTARYTVEVNDAIERYLTSPVSELGRITDYVDNKRVEKESRVAWLITKGGGKRLIYMDRIFSAWYQERIERGDHEVKRSDAYDSDENKLSLDQQAEWSSHGHVRTDSEKPLREDRMLSFVELEFRDLALQKQEKIWLKAPEVYMEDWEHQVAYGVPSIKKVAGS